jgi:hypothetical protein
MKKVIVEKVHEEAKFYCDKHPDRECFTEIKSSCWYGSKFDLFHIKTNLCDECMEELYTFMKEKFGVEPFDDEISLYGRI